MEKLGTIVNKIWPMNQSTDIGQSQTYRYRYMSLMLANVLNLNNTMQKKIVGVIYNEIE